MSWGRTLGSSTPHGGSTPRRRAFVVLIAHPMRWPPELKICKRERCVRMDTATSGWDRGTCLDVVGALVVEGRVEDDLVGRLRSDVTRGKRGGHSGEFCGCCWLESFGLEIFRRALGLGTLVILWENRLLDMDFSGGNLHIFAKNAYRSGANIGAPFYR